jgi:hypothetical protein
MSSSREDAREALDDFVKHAIDSGEAEVDPYSYAITVIATVLEFALDDGISGAMSEGEFKTLDLIAKTLMVLDPALGERWGRG